MEYYFGENFCKNLVGIAGRVRSLHTIGDGYDYTKPSLTVFEGTYFKGEAWHLHAHEWPEFFWAGRNISIIVTGSVDDGWKFYEEPNYQGKSVCVSPSSTDVPYEPAFIYDMNLTGMGSFASAHKGCSGAYTKVNSDAIATRTKVA